MPRGSRLIRVFCKCRRCHSLPASDPIVRYGVTIATAGNHARVYKRAFPSEYFSYSFQPYRQGPAARSFNVNRRQYNRDQYPSNRSDDSNDDSEDSAYSDDGGEPGDDGGSDPASEPNSESGSEPGSEPGTEPSSEPDQPPSPGGQSPADLAKAELKSRQPGNDGGVKKDRHKGGKFNKEGLLRATPAVRDRVVEICIMHLADKEEGKSHSEADYERAMRTTRRVLRRSRDREEHKVAYLLPWTFKGALSLLENSDQARGFLGEAGIIEYDMCPVCNSVYRNERQRHVCCARCAAKGVESLRVNASKLMYCTIEAHMRRCYGNPVLAEGMRNHAERLSTDGSIADSGDSDVVKRLRRCMGGHPGDVVIYLYYDPYQPFNDNAKYSSAPLVCIIQNLPQHTRWEHSAAHLVCLQEGSRDKDVVPDRSDMMELVADELEWLGSEGVSVWDAVSGKNISVHVRLGALLSDYRGLQEVTKMKGAPTEYGCFKCWHLGFWAVAGKRVWCNHFTRLPAGHPLRDLLCQGHNPPVPRGPHLPPGPPLPPPVRLPSAAPPRLRTRTELHQNLGDPLDPAPLVPGEPSPVTLDVGQAPLATVLVGHPTRVQASIPLWHLLYMDLTASIQYDCMHTFSGNVKDIFLMLCGYLPKPDSLIPQYEIQINKRWLQGENHTRLRPEAKARLEHSLKENARYVHDGTRLEHLMMPSAAHKAHTHIQTCSCLGLYAIAMAATSPSHPLPAPQAHAIMGLLHAIGELWSHDVLRADIPALERQLVEAVCRCELHLSTNLCDIKFHNLLHAAASLLALGPLPHWSMFQAESAWGWLKANCRNANHAEATMLFSWQDKMLAETFFLRSLDPRNPYYYTEHYIAHPDRITVSLPRLKPIQCDEEEHVALLQYYIAVLPVFQRLWTTAWQRFTDTHSPDQCNRVGLHRSNGAYHFATAADQLAFYLEHFADDVESSVGRNLYRDEKALCTQRDTKWRLKVWRDAQRSTRLELGPLTLNLTNGLKRRGDFWVMHRKGADEAFRSPRFSNFLGAYLHMGPDKVEHTFVRVEWRKQAPSDYHTLIKAPLAMVEKDEKLLKFCLARDVVPHPCWGMRNPYDHSQLVMLTEKRWHLLRHLNFDPIR